MNACSSEQYQRSILLFIPTRFSVAMKQMLKHPLRAQVTRVIDRRRFVERLSEWLRVYKTIEFKLSLSETVNVYDPKGTDTRQEVVDPVAV